MLRIGSWCSKVGSRGLALALLGSLLGCSSPADDMPPTASERTSEREPVGPDGPTKPASDPLVGYDLRRLRPNEDESLADMFDRVRAKAVEEGKRVVVLFSADWCEPCKALDLELGNQHPASMIGDVRILELKEDDWKAAARMDEYNQLRSRWEPALGSYPLVLMLDAKGKRIDEMKDAKQRLEQQGLEPTLPVWFASGSSVAEPAAGG